MIPGPTGRGTVLPGFLDAHVHLALIDPKSLVRGGIGRVLDLGGWRPGRPDCSMPDAAYAYQFITTPGGYPSRTEWAQPGWSVPVGSAAEARPAVDRQVSAGASVLKLTLNIDAGPVLGTEALAAVVGRAHEQGLPVVVHAEGAGQAERACTAGIDAFAHTPFTERLPDSLIMAMAARMTWISTLDMHGWGTPTAAFELAQDNLRRFHAAGGRVLYGTDLGNGPLPLGVNAREIEALLGAGLTPDDVLRALCSASPLGLTLPDTRVTFISVARPSDPADFAGWLVSARSLTHSELEDLP